MMKGNGTESQTISKNVIYFNKQWQEYNGVITFGDTYNSQVIYIAINNTNFAYGDGAYRISFYAKNAIDGSWDVSYLFFTLDQMNFTLSDGSSFAVLTDRAAPTDQ